jgi:hypothetical protein
MFGKKGADMVRFATNGVAGLTEAQAAAESLGLALDRKTVAGVDRAGEAFARFKMAVGGIFRSLVAEIAPFVEILSNKAFALLASSGAGKSLGSGIADAVISMTKFVADGIQKMVGAVISMVAEFKAIIAGFRGSDSWLAKQMGVNVGEEENRKNWNDVGDWRKMAKDFVAKPWSEAIETQIAEAKAKAEEQAKNSPAEQKRSLPQLLKQDPIIGALMKSGGAAAGNIKDFGGQLVQGVTQGLKSVPGLINQAQWAGMQFQGNNFKGAAAMGQRPAIAFAESGSADSYRQQAAIRRQSEGIAKQQLAVQKQMRDGINKIADAPPMRPANFKG